ncbi:5693_t:CDS:2 [Paraglomus brasilianum]|uniref:5693_t:CDS:1 n=1 Tax=Paraglomus brasilianum TaxID=144538 RepID=A0A9N8WJS5_9GLOM|nr:5693_t:CDS:2 [Paraglomus brasilianum]
MQLLGVTLPDNKYVKIALTYFYGIGLKTAEQICSKISIHKTCRLSELTEPQLNRLALLLSQMTLESELKRVVKANILHHRQIGTYIGKRHVMGYPVRGQRTKTNARTARKLNGKSITREYSSLALLHSSPSASDHLLKQHEAGFLTGPRNFNGLRYLPLVKLVNLFSRVLKR